MINYLKPYPKYKDSGVPWLGKVPEHWEVLPPKRVLRSRSSGAAPIKNTASPNPREGYVPAFSASGQDVWLPEPMFHGPGLVLSAVGARCGKTFRADGAWAIVANTHVLLVNDGNHRDYWWYITNDENWWERAGAAQPFVQVGRTLDRPWAVPPLPEQTAIVRFLDWADRRIRRVIRLRNQRIKLLEEYKQALINRAVTGKIDVRTCLRQSTGRQAGKPYPKYKDSGVQWLGEVPEDWELKPLKHWVQINASVLPDTTPADYEFRYLDIGTVGTGSLTGEPQRLRFGNAPSRARRVLNIGDSIISTVRTYLKAVYYVDIDANALVCSTGFAVLTPSPSTQPKYVSYLMQSNAFTDRVTAESVGTAYPAISEERLGSFYVPIPPLSEQTAMVEYLDAQTAKLDAAIAATRREIELLKEFRTRLIADVVTGKLDVREVAAKLPDEPPEEETSEGDEIAEEAEREAVSEEAKV